jgi:hypothetical protein
MRDAGYSSNQIQSSLFARRSSEPRVIDEYPFSGSSVYSIDQILEAVQLDGRWYAKSG